MEWQTIINFGGSALLAALGWFARQIWDSVQELKDRKSTRLNSSHT